MMVRSEGTGWYGDNGPGILGNIDTWNERRDEKQADIFDAYSYYRLDIFDVLKQNSEAIESNEKDERRGGQGTRVI